MARCKKCKGKLDVRVIEERKEANYDLYHGYCKKCNISWILEINVMEQLNPNQGRTNGK